MDLEQLPDGPDGRRWLVSQVVDVPEWVVALGLKHQCFHDGTLVLPDGPHAFWDDLDKGPPNTHRYTVRLTNE